MRSTVALTRRKIGRNPYHSITVVGQEQEAYDQACRQRWRALLLVIRAKLEAVTVGISTIETEFLANIVLPDNTTAGEWMLPQIDRAYRTDEMPPLLPAAGSPDPRSSNPIPLPPA